MNCPRSRASPLSCGGSAYRCQTARPRPRRWRRRYGPDTRQRRLHLRRGHVVCHAARSRTSRCASSRASWCSSWARPARGSPHCFASAPGCSAPAADRPRSTETALSRSSARGRVGLVFQDAEAQLFAETLLADVAFGPREPRRLRTRRCVAVPARRSRRLGSTLTPTAGVRRSRCPEARRAGRRSRAS